MNKLIAIALFTIGAAGLLSATTAVPEIDPASGANALALVTGAFFVIRGMRRK